MHFRKHLIDIKATAREALQLLELIPDSESRTLFVLEENKLVGSLTDGDIRRGLLKDKEISDCVECYMHSSCKSLLKKHINPKILSLYRKKEIWLLPVVNENNEIVEIIDLKNLRTVIPASVLIMAGGRGERLRPLTDSLPKPMLKVGHKPIIEFNIDRFIQFGIKHFYISVRYLSEKIINYLGDGSSKGVCIQYIHEDEPLGTLGACSMIDNLEFDHLIVMNADILTNIDFGDLFNYFQTREALMCAASIPYDVKVPYGVMQLDDKNYVRSLVEKPTYTYFANAGIYLLHKKLIQSIPRGIIYNATDLMQQLIDNNERLVHYPILQYWLDIGRYEDYLRAQEDYKHINF